MDISKIKIQFGGKFEPKDERLITLLKKAYKGDILVRVASILVEGIKPFSDFKPEISENFKNIFEEKEKNGKPPPLYVYPDGKYFIMSDDYRSYYLYKEKNYSKIICIVLGDSESKFIIEKSESFKLPVPSFN